MMPALRRLKLLDGVEAYQAVRAFWLACGDRLRERVRGERFSHGTLYVRVESSAWANEISFMKASLLQRIREQPGGQAVRELRFTVGPLTGMPDWSEPPKPAPPPVQPTPMDPRVAAELRQLADEDLRDALGALYVFSCRAGRKKPG